MKSRYSVWTYLLTHIYIRKCWFSNVPFFFTNSESFIQAYLLRCLNRMIATCKSYSFVMSWERLICWLNMGNDLSTPWTLRNNDEIKRCRLFSLQLTTKINISSWPGFKHSIRRHDFNGTIAHLFFFFNKIRNLTRSRQL